MNVIFGVVSADGVSAYPNQTNLTRNDKILISARVKPKINDLHLRLRIEPFLNDSPNAMVVVNRWALHKVHLTQSGALTGESG